MFSGWVSDNIYGYKKIDGIMYLFFYIIIPVIVTALSLYFFPTLNTACAYCYMTILISCLNCMYDAANRWKSGEKTVVNTKLVIMVIPILIISVYCFFEIMYILVTSRCDVRYDGFFCLYFVPIVIAMIDIGCCFASEMTLRKCANKE